MRNWPEYKLPVRKQRRFLFFFYIDKEYTYIHGVPPFRSTPAFIMVSVETVKVQISNKWKNATWVSQLMTQFCSPITLSGLHFANILVTLLGVQEVHNTNQGILGKN